MRDADGEATHLSQWAGLAKRSPLVAGVMAFLLLALAGIPLTSGFTAKFAVFAAALGDGMAPLVVIALVVSAVAAFFYLRVIVLMYFSEPPAGRSRRSACPGRSPPPRSPSACSSRCCSGSRPRWPWTGPPAAAS